MGYLTKPELDVLFDKVYKINSLVKELTEYKVDELILLTDDKIHELTDSILLLMHGYRISKHPLSDKSFEYWRLKSIKNGLTLGGVETLKAKLIERKIELNDTGLPQTGKQQQINSVPAGADLPDPLDIASKFIANAKTPIEDRYTKDEVAFSMMIARDNPENNNYSNLWDIVINHIDCPERLKKADKKTIKNHMAYYDEEAGLRPHKKRSKLQK